MMSYLIIELQVTYDDNWSDVFAVEVVTESQLYIQVIFPKRTLPVVICQPQVVANVYLTVPECLHPRFISVRT